MNNFNFISSMFSCNMPPKQHLKFLKLMKSKIKVRSIFEWIFYGTWSEKRSHSTQKIRFTNIEISEIDVSIMISCFWKGNWKHSIFTIVQNRKVNKQFFGTWYIFRPHVIFEIRYSSQNRGSILTAKMLFLQLIKNWEFYLIF